MKRLKETVRDFFARKGIFIHRGEIRGLSLFDELHFGSSSNVFIDVGANQGDFTIQLAKRWPHSKIFCFEPSPKILPRLKRNTERFGSRIEVIESGVGEHITSADFFETLSADTGSFRVRSDQGKLKRIKAIPLTSIDAFCKSRDVDQIDFLKIDTEGYDNNVLKGAQGMLSCGCVRMVQVEATFSAINTVHVHFHDILSLMPSNFQIYGFYEQIPEYEDNLHLRRANVVFFNAALF